MVSKRKAKLIQRWLDEVAKEIVKVISYDPYPWFRLKLNESRVLTDRDCYYGVYGDLIYCVDHYHKPFYGYGHHLMMMNQISNMIMPPPILKRKRSKRKKKRRRT